jgi:hypothetical protein
MWDDGSFPVKTLTCIAVSSAFSYRVALQALGAAGDLNNEIVSASSIN